MASSFSSYFFLLCVLFISQCTNTNCAEDDTDLLKAIDVKKDPGVQVFFKFEDLKVGAKFPIYFKVETPAQKAMRFLPKEKADSIPFSSKHLPQLLKLFSFAENSVNAKKMKFTFRACERKPAPREVKFCATSLESLTESIGGILGLDAPIDVLTTNLSPDHKTELQNYTVVGEPKKVDTHKQLGCHTMPYPYKVLFCHTQMRDHMIYKIPMVGDDGEKVEAIGACHSDTADFDPNHVVFRVLKTKPGSIVCHFMPANDYFFVRSPTTV